MVHKLNLLFLAFYSSQREERVPVHKAKKEYMSYAKVLEKMGSAKSSALRGKGKARDLGKSVVELIDLDFGSPKLSSISQ